MFENLQDGLKSAFKSIAGKGKLTESNMRDGLKIVEQSLLEADVSYEVVQRFMERVSTQALGEKVLLSLKPSEQLISIVHQELIDLLGSDEEPLKLNSDRPTILMLCGLQGSGKTTTCGKLTVLLKQNKITPMLVAADLQRPAAIEQLHVIGRDLDVPVYSEPGAKDPVKVCQDAVAKAIKDGNKVIILDTAGRLAIDAELMEQLKQIDRKVGPDQVFLVVDGMTGQDAVNSADAFNQALELNGVIMTKLDGDARGGALLSVRDVTGVPIKFIGTGERMDALEPFRAEGMAGRILGQGDIVELARTAQSLVNEQEQERLREQLEKGEFTLEDFRNHIEKIAKPGLMQKMMALMPGMGELSKMMNDVDSASETRRFIGIIDSMTPAEKRNPKLIDQSRRSRIAAGAGVQPQRVNELVKQYDTMKPLLTSMAGGNRREAMAMLNDFKNNAMADPTGRLMSKPKKGTGKRMSAKEREKFKKQRDRELRRKKREKRRGPTGGDAES
jgi:signal recognition particle subunit SRP54